MDDGRILLYCPTYDISGQEQIRPETKQCIAAIAARRPDVDVVISKNNPYVIGAYANVLHQYQDAEKMVREGGYRALFTVEHDMWLPDDALQRLWDTGAPVAYGIYLFRHGVHVLNVLERYPGKARNMGESISLHQKVLEQYTRRGVHPCSGVGLGCTLIRRGVLERIPFREPADSAGGADMALAADCMRAGIQQVADLGVRCGHWDVDRWVWPFEDEETVQVEALQRVTVPAGHRSLALKPGCMVALPVGNVNDLVRAGYVRIARGAMS